MPQPVTPQNQQPRAGLARRQLWLTALLLAVTLLVLSGATYAWFTFSAYTNVTPMQGRVSPGEMSLMISSSAGGTFDVTAPITQLGSCQTLTPVSTANLSGFYTALGSSRSGIAAMYRDVTATADTLAYHGEVYLRAEYADGALYFDPNNLAFTGSPQLLASLRLGLTFTAGSRTESYIFRLDDAAATGGAAANVTSGGGNENVVTAVAADGSAAFGTDVARSVSAYLAAAADANADPAAGQSYLFLLTAGETARCEIWLYMEGTDANCLNEAQLSEIGMTLAFAGTSREGAYLN